MDIDLSFLDETSNNFVSHFDPLSFGRLAWPFLILLGLCVASALFSSHRSSLPARVLSLVVAVVIAWCSIFMLAVMSNGSRPYSDRPFWPAHTVPVTTRQVDEKGIDARTMQAIRSTYRVNDLKNPQISIDPDSHAISGSLLAKTDSSYQSCVLQTTEEHQWSDHVVMLCNGSEPSKR